MTPGNARLFSKKFVSKKSFRKNPSLKEENMLNGLQRKKNMSNDLQEKKKTC